MVDAETFEQLAYNWAEVQMEEAAHPDADFHALTEVAMTEGSAWTVLCSLYDPSRMSDVLTQLTLAGRQAMCANTTSCDVTVVLPLPSPPRVPPPQPTPLAPSPPLGPAVQGRLLSVPRRLQLVDTRPPSAPLPLQGPTSPSPPCWTAGPHPGGPGGWDSGWHLLEVFADGSANWASYGVRQCDWFASADAPADACTRFKWQSVLPTEYCCECNGGTFMQPSPPPGPPSFPPPPPGPPAAPGEIVAPAVAATFQISGATIENFNADAQVHFASRLATMLSVDETDITLTVAAGSVVVTALIAVGNVTAQATVMETLSNLPQEELEAALQVTLEASLSVVTAVITFAAPPPMPPPLVEALPVVTARRVHTVGSGATRSTELEARFQRQLASMDHIESMHNLSHLSTALTQLQAVVTVTTVATNEERAREVAFGLFEGFNYTHLQESLSDQIGGVGLSVTGRAEFIHPDDGYVVINVAPLAYAPVSALTAAEPKQVEVTTIDAVTGAVTALVAMAVIGAVGGAVGGAAGGAGGGGAAGGGGGAGGAGAGGLSPLIFGVQRLSLSADLPTEQSNLTVGVAEGMAWASGDIGLVSPPPEAKERRMSETAGGEFGSGGAGSGDLTNLPADYPLAYYTLFSILWLCGIVMIPIALINNFAIWYWLKRANRLYYAEAVEIEKIKESDISRLKRRILLEPFKAKFYAIPGLFVFPNLYLVVLKLFVTGMTAEAVQLVLIDDESCPTECKAPAVFALILIACFLGLGWIAVTDINIRFRVKSWKRTPRPSSPNEVGDPLFRLVSRTRVACCGSTRSFTIAQRLAGKFAKPKDETNEPMRTERLLNPSKLFVLRRKHMADTWDMYQFAYLPKGGGKNCVGPYYDIILLSIQVAFGALGGFGRMITKGTPEAFRNVALKFSLQALFCVLVLCLKPTPDKMDSFMIGSMFAMEATVTAMLFTSAVYPEHVDMEELLLNTFYIGLTAMTIPLIRRFYDAVIVQCCILARDKKKLNLKNACLAMLLFLLELWKWLMSFLGMDAEAVGESKKTAGGVDQAAKLLKRTSDQTLVTHNAVISMALDAAIEMLADVFAINQQNCHPVHKIAASEIQCSARRQIIQKAFKEQQEAARTIQAAARVFFVEKRARAEGTLTPSMPGFRWLNRQMDVEEAAQAVEDLEPLQKHPSRMVRARKSNSKAVQVRVVAVDPEKRV